MLRKQSVNLQITKLLFKFSSDSLSAFSRKSLFNFSEIVSGKIRRLEGHVVEMNGSDQARALIS